MITLQDYLTSSGKYPLRYHSNELTSEKTTNALLLLKKVNELLILLGVKAPTISSGFRTLDANLKAGGATHSTHMECMAIDFEDPHHDFYNLCEENIDCLIKCGLYMESGLHTPSWTHLQIKPTHNRIFLP